MKWERDIFGIREKVYLFIRINVTTNKQKTYLAEKIIKKHAFKQIQGDCGVVFHKSMVQKIKILILIHQKRLFSLPQIMPIILKDKYKKILIFFLKKSNRLAT